jgi:putative ABC transport system permease protein
MPVATSIRRWHGEGTTRARIASIFAWEFAFLGLAIAVAALGVGTLGAMALTLAFGLAGTLAALRQRPLALLRNE